MLASFLASKVTSTMAMAKVGGEATGTFLAGLSSKGVSLVSQAASPAATVLEPWLETLNAAGILQVSSDALAGAASSIGRLAVVAVPMVLSAVGFTGAGITASSLAAKMRSVTAIANGGGVPAGSLVATLQSVGLAVVAVPMVLSAVGFTGAGITASSLAAKMMSVTAIANGGGVPAGSLVATLQSVGAAGLSTSSNIIIGSLGSASSFLIARVTGL
ncbi:Interferon alpha-inducible protein 27 [Heterocephalus glaber]|uniref:Interferon alpha-inducible protein 27 n=1 Tax=Heterocephalus glaber TaxID=10181 RepID=G5AXJ5_HETGA|nr:Interferon alpha-inducible protein 27 [Heterocephalus glaber]